MGFGRKSSVGKEKIIAEVEKRKADIVHLVNDTYKIVDKYHQVWEELSLCFGETEGRRNLQPFSVYYMITGNRYGLRELLCRQPVGFNDNEAFTDSVSEEELECTDQEIFNKGETVSFCVTIESCEFEDLVHVVKRKKTVVGKRPSFCRRLAFRPGKWEIFFTDKIWNELHIRCAFQFDEHYLSTDGENGTIAGRLEINFVNYFYLRLCMHFFN